MLIPSATTSGLAMSASLSRGVNANSQHDAHRVPVHGKSIKRQVLIPVS